VNPDRWRRVKEICGSALERPPEDREGFVASSCAGDASLRAEVDSLLANASQIEGFLQVPAMPGTTAPPGGNATGAAIDLTGKTILHYAITEKIGEGGMGVVYKATDVRLGRIVALKFLPEAVSCDRLALERFRREARAASRLNHPRICTLHDIAEHDGRTFLVLECLDGETLAATLARGPMPLAKALDVGAEIADALSAAHAEGIVHRDLKPGNVMLTKTGAKLLDFGLAKLSGSGRPALSAAGSVESLSAADWGLVAGTVPYMAPEQLEGRPVDARTDVWALGAILYEMVAGRRAFDAPSQASLIAGILERQPAALAEIQPLTPPLLAHVVTKCLAKSQDDRWGSASDVAHLLRLIRNPGSVSRPVEKSTRRRAVWRWGGLAAVLLVALALLAAAVWLPRARVEPARSAATPTGTPHRFTISLPPDLPLAPGGSMQEAHDRPVLALSHDGTRLAYVAQVGSTTQICVRDMADIVSGRVSQLAGTEGGHSPFFSPDGSRLAFFAEGKLKWTTLTGGNAVTLADAPNPFGGSWGTDGWIYFTRQPNEGVQKVRWDAGDVLMVTPSLLRMPERLDRGPCLLGTAGEGTFCVDEATQKQRLVVSGYGARYVQTGHLVYALPGRLLAASYDIEKGVVTSRSAPVFEDLRTAPFGIAQFTIGHDGTLIYATGTAQNLSSFVWVDRNGGARPMGLPAAPYSAFDLSPDGTRLAYGVEDADGRITQVFVRNLLTARTTPVAPRVSTGQPPWIAYPRWSDDSHLLCFARTQAGVLQIVMHSLDAGEEPVELWVSEPGGPTYLNPMSITPDRSALIAYGQSKGRGLDIFRLRAPGPGGRWTQGPEPLLATESSDYFGEVSPDGRWLLFTSDRLGRNQVYVTSYPVPGPTCQISRDGGHKPAWARGGKEIVYKYGGTMYVAAVKAGARFEAAEPRRLFEGPYPNIPGFDFAIGPSGEFVMLENPAFFRPATTLTVVTNFFDVLQGLAPSLRK
jgi:eukaryotic-like serine/threonine-protein kinase